jgi:ubiquinone/menaquinone biosynthesis C-methylase UbiE
MGPNPVAATTFMEQDPVVDETDSLLDIAKQEDSKFRCDDSVAFWRQFTVMDMADATRIVGNLLQPYLASGGGASIAARAYWIYHALRVGYFTGNAFTGLLAVRIHKAVENRALPDFSSTFSLVSSAGYLLLTEAFLSMEQNWKWVEKGILNYPWDATIMADLSTQQFRLQLDHKQSNPLFAIAESIRLIQDSISILNRQARLEGKPVGVKLDNEQASDLYPSYYLNDFHYQQNGWMSSTSAERYEVGTETLFLGRQDSMQRQTLVPIRKRYSKRTPPTAMLEVACGTGRYATFARDNFPTTNMTLVDLSPFYLEKAKENDTYWRSKRAKEAMKTATGVAKEAPDTTQFVQANAERLPFADNSFDVVTSVYLFHELPHDARVIVAAEMARVCKPGGMVVFSDSMQVHDRPLLHKATPMDSFTKMNEPHYASYIREDLPALFETQGLVSDEKYMNSQTKTLSFVKKNE